MSSTTANPLLPAVPPDWPFGSRPAFRDPAAGLAFDSWLQPEPLPAADPEPVIAPPANTVSEARPNEQDNHQESLTDSDIEAATHDSAVSADKDSQPDDPTSEAELPSEVVQALSGAAAIVVATNVPAAANEAQSGEPANLVAATEVAIGGEPTVSATGGVPDHSSLTVEPVEIHPSVASSAESGGKPAKAAATGGESGSLELLASADAVAAEFAASDSDDHESNQPNDDSGSREPDPLTNQSLSSPLGTGEAKPLDFKPDQAPESKGQATNSPTPLISSAAAADAPRIRLPAEILVPASANARPGIGVEIDATRLLHRVARAFAQAADRSGEVTIRLSPPELGALRLEVQVREGVLTAHLQAETPEARTAILENLSALRERLADQGVRIERFDVDLMNRQSGGSPQQAFSDQRESPRTWRPVNEANSATKPPTTVPQLSKTTATGPGRLNVIV